MLCESGGSSIYSDVWMVPGVGGGGNSMGWGIFLVGVSTSRNIINMASSLMIHHNKFKWSPKILPGVSSKIKIT